MTARHRWLAAALIATLVAAFWPAREESPDGVEPAERKRAPVPSGTAPAASGEAGAQPGASTRLAAMQSDLFPRQTWVPPLPPPKPYVAPPPPPPSPPPLPFKYLGRWVDAGRLTLFLVQGEQPIPARAGQVLLGAWRVDTITERQVVFTYLPLDMQSTLGITP